MKLEHHFTVPAPFDAVWASFDDLEHVVPCVPGAALTAVDGDDFEGTVKVKLGPISMTYSGKGSFIERDRDTGRVVVEAKGKDKRGNGTAGATVTAQVTADGDTTVVDVSTDLAVTGKPAQFGRGVIQDVSEKLLAQFVECFAAQLQAGDAVAGSSADAAAAAGADGAAAAATEAAAGADEDAGAAHPVGTQHPGTSSSSAFSASSVPTSSAPAELDLFASVAPVLLKRYAVPVAAIVGLILGYALGRRRRH